MDATNDVYQFTAKLISHSSRIRCVTFSPDSLLLASGGEDKTVNVWAVTSGNLVQKLTGHKDYVLSLAFSPDGQLLASSSSDDTIRLWRAPHWELTQILKFEGGGFPYPIAFSPSGEFLAGGMSSGLIGLWRIPGGNRVNFPAGHKGPVWSIAFSPSGELLASGNAHTSGRWLVGPLLGLAPGVDALGGGIDIRIWRASGGSFVRKLRGQYNGGVRSLEFSPDGKLIAAACNNSDVRFWTVSGDPKPSLDWRKDFVDSVSFSPDGQLLASSINTGSTVIWDLSLGAVVQTLEGRFSRFSPDGGFLATVTDEESRTIGIWKYSDISKSRNPNEIAAQASPKQVDTVVVAEGELTHRQAILKTLQIVTSFLEVQELSKVAPVLLIQGCAIDVFKSDIYPFVAYSAYKSGVILAWWDFGKRSDLRKYLRERSLDGNDWFLVKDGILVKYKSYKMFHAPSDEIQSLQSAISEEIKTIQT